MKDDNRGVFKYMHYSTIGIEMAVSVAVGGFFGWWLDGKLGTTPWFFIFWLLCGVAAGFRSLFKLAKKYMKDIKEDEHQGSNGT